MKVNLLQRQGGPEFLSAPDSQWEDRWEDLKLAPVLKAMSKDDPLISSVCRQILDQPLESREEILYRQEILRECLQKRALLKKLYDLCQEAETRRKNTWYRMTSPHLTTIYSSAAELLKIYMETLIRIRRTMEAEEFSSRGLAQLQALLSRELSDDYLEQVRSLQYGIQDDEGILISAGFGDFLQGVSYVKRQPKGGLSRLRWMLCPSFTLADRDMNGAKDLEIRRDRAINQVANSMAQAAGSLQSFTDRLRQELSFYVGAGNLYDRLTDLGLALCFPVFSRDNIRKYQNLTDCSLALTTGTAPVGNFLTGEHKQLFLITGANQGGKTTFLRSLGLCQLMAQCGLFVSAEACTLPINTQIYTHFCREEDPRMDSGKLDEELRRMSRIVDTLKPGAMLLSNESFASTNDRDGSEIFEGITRALLETGIQVFSVTHLLSFALALAPRPDTLCLRAQRGKGGTRTFRMEIGPPLHTAFGEDLYKQVFS